MREEDANWFSKWEEQLPPPEELTPLSQTLISRDLALAFDIQPNSSSSSAHFLHHHYHHHRPTPASSAELGGGGSDEPARTLKRPRLVWTPQLHKRFVDAVAHLGIKNAVPKTIMQLMSVDGLTRENVASHLQKYRLYLKRMQGINNGAAASSAGSGDAATDHLFASSPVPAHFLNPQAGAGGRPNSVHSDHLMGYLQPPPPLHHHHHHHRQVGHFGSPTSGGGGGGGHPFLSRQAHQMGGLRIGGGLVRNSVSGYVEDLDSGTVASGRKVLTLFPTADE